MWMMLSRYSRGIVRFTVNSQNVMHSRRDDTGRNTCKTHAIRKSSSSIKKRVRNIRVIYILYYMCNQFSVFGLRPWFLYIYKSVYKSAIYDRQIL